MKEQILGLASLSLPFYKVDNPHAPLQSKTLTNRDPCAMAARKRPSAEKDMALTAEAWPLLNLALRSPLLPSSR